MVHRAIVGSIERAVAQLIEVHGGAFPAWLAPVQLVVLPISDDEEKLAAEVARRASDRGLRVEVAHADEGSLGARIRENRLAPYQAVIGAREAAAGLLAVRQRDGRQLEPAEIGEVLDELRDNCQPAARAVRSEFCDRRRRIQVATGTTMSVPIRALRSPPQSKMSSSPMPRPSVKIT